MLAQQEGSEPLDENKMKSLSMLIKGIIAAKFKKKMIDLDDEPKQIIEEKFAKHTCDHFCLKKTVLACGMDEENIEIPQLCANHDF